MSNLDKRHAGSAATLAAELRLVLGRLTRRLRSETGSSDLTSSEKVVLALLEREGPATISTLARNEGVRPQSMGATIAALQSRNLVAGAPDPGDGRQTLLSLTPACRKMLVAGRSAREDWLFRAIQSNFNAAEQAELARAIQLLSRFLD